MGAVAFAGVLMRVAPMIATALVAAVSSVRRYSCWSRALVRGNRFARCTLPSVSLDEMCSQAVGAALTAQAAATAYDCHRLCG